MKYSKRYIAFTGVLAAALLIKFNNFGEQYQTVNRFRGAQLEEETGTMMSRFESMKN